MIARAEGFTGKVSNSTSTDANGTANSLSDAQILGIRGLLEKQATGNFDPKASGAAAFALTGVKGQPGIQKMQELMNQYSQNPQYTSQDKRMIDNIINGTAQYSDKSDPQGYVLDAVKKAAARAGVSDWKPTDYNNENTTKLQFTIGKSGEAISAAATALDHMADYKMLLATNGNTSIPAVNSAMNRLKSAFGDSGTTNLNVIAGLVGDELANAYNINAESGKERKAADFAANLAPSQGAGAVDTQIMALRQRLKNLNDVQWKPIMKSDNEQIMKLIGGDSQSSDSGNGGINLKGTNLQEFMNKYNLK